MASVNLAEAVADKKPPIGGFFVCYGSEAEKARGPTTYELKQRALGQSAQVSQHPSRTAGVGVSRHIGHYCHDTLCPDEGIEWPAGRVAVRFRTACKEAPCGLISSSPTKEGVK